MFNYAPIKLATVNSPRRIVNTDDLGRPDEKARNSRADL